VAGDLASAARNCSRRILTTDADDVMPPPKMGKPLTPE
jgi:hypothetical protein